MNAHDTSEGDTVDKPDICPGCGDDMNYTERGLKMTRRVGIEVRGVYDGVLFWADPACGHKWNRWRPEDGRLYAAAEHYMGPRPS